ncbi:HNH endonuclease [Corynebacterium sp. Marseille-P3884]|nr:HNH endonuclease [Corynebacterium sp. Marseille-P3884]
MTSFDSVLSGLASPMDFLAGFDRQKALDAGLDPAMVRKWGKVNDVYFGKTKWTAKQRKAVECARAAGFTADQLHLIEKKLNHIDDDGEKWALRFELLGVRGQYDTLERRTKEIVPAKEEPVPKNAVRISKSKQGKMRLSVVGDEHDIAALETALRKKVTAQRPASPQMYDALIDLLYKGGGVAREAPRPFVLIPLPDYVDIIEGKGDDVVLTLTNGTTMSGAEYLQRVHGEELNVGLFDAHAGPVNAYRAQRFANDKQRMLASAVSPVCVVPDCRHGADHCEVHHITPWSRGGQTNMNNLAMLCTYHNRTNDDAPWRRKRGRVVNVRGRPFWRSPRGYRAMNEPNRKGAMHQLFGPLRI